MSVIRIAFVIDTIDTPAAGTERQLLALLAGLDRREFAPQLVCLHESPWIAEQRFDFPVTFLGIHSLRRPAVLPALARFRRICRETPVDLVQTFFVEGNVFGTLGAALAGRPALVSSRRNIGHWHNRTQVALLRGLRRWTDFYLANSRAVAERTVTVEGVRPERVEVIQNGLEFEDPAIIPPDRRRNQRAAWGIADGETLVGTVANLREIKNLPEFVEAAARAAAARDDLRFVVVGEGPDHAALEALVAGRGLTGRFRLAGRMLDVRPALAAFDVGIQCSRAESSSNSLIEAMAAGLAVAASDIPGNSEAIVHEESGLLYPLGRPDALAEAILRLSGDAGLRTRLGGEARRVARETYSMSRCLERHAAFYRRVLAERHAR